MKLLPSDLSESLLVGTFVFTFVGALIAPALEAALPRDTSASPHDKHPLHTLGSRAAFASTSGAFINYSSSSDTVSVLVPDHLEYVRGAATEKIIVEALQIAAQQPFYFPPRTQR